MMVSTTFASHNLQKIVRQDDSVYTSVVSVVSYRHKMVSLRNIVRVIMMYTDSGLHTQWFIDDEEVTFKDDSCKGDRQPLITQLAARSKLCFPTSGSFKIAYVWRSCSCCDN